MTKDQLQIAAYKHFQCKEEYNDSHEYWINPSITIAGICDLYIQITHDYEIEGFHKNPQFKNTFFIQCIKNIIYRYINQHIIDLPYTNTYVCDNLPGCIYSTIHNTYYTLSDSMIRNDDTIDILLSFTHIIKKTDKVYKNYKGIHIYTVCDPINGRSFPHGGIQLRILHCNNKRLEYEESKLIYTD